MCVISLLCLTWLMVGNVGAELSPVVTFNPDWNKIFQGESINLTCDVDSTVEGDVTYHWFKHGYWIQAGKTFTIASAETSNSGNYQCQTSSGEKSDPATLEVYNGYVLLQASPYVYEGDNLTLRCHHHPGYSAKQTKFYKNTKVIKDWGPEDELHIKNVDVTSTSKYTCTKQVHHHLVDYQHSNEISVSVQELLSLPTIRLSRPSVTEGDRITLTCHTRLSPRRQTTVLQFAFYRGGQNIREFSSSDKYEIVSAKERDSGDYKCEVKTSNYKMKKMSTIFTIQVRRNSEQVPFDKSETDVTSQPGTSHLITAVSVTSLVLVLVLTFAGLNFLYRTSYFLRVNNQQPSKAESKEPDGKAENIYTDLDMNYRWQNSSPNPHKPNVCDLVTQNDFIVC